MRTPVITNIEVDGRVEGCATIRGISTKTIFLLAITVITSLYVMLYPSTVFSNYTLWVLGSSIVGFIAVIAGQRNPNIAMPASIIYSVCEGILLGSISLIAAVYYAGAVEIAIMGTFSVFFVMLVLYRTRLVVATDRMRKTMYGIMFGLLIFSLISIVMSVFGISLLTSLFATSPLLAVGICGFFIAFGAFMLVLDFDNISRMVDGGFDKKYEWMASLGLMVTLIYIYVQILRFLIMIIGRRD